MDTLAPSRRGESEPCLICRNTSAPELPAREQVLRTDHWRAAHAFDSGLRGWLVLLPTRHVTALDELDTGAAGELGTILSDLSAALRAVVGCEKTYVMLFSEAEGFSHLHLHVVPRMPDQPADLRGPRIFAMLGVSPSARVPDHEMDEIALALRDALGGQGRRRP